MRFHSWLVLATLAAPAGAHAADVCSTGGEGANLRSAPSIHGNRTSAIQEGGRVEVLGTSGDWTRIRSNGRTGWMASRYVCSGLPSTNAPPPPIAPEPPSTPSAAAAACTDDRPAAPLVDLAGVDPYCSSCVSSALESLGGLLASVRGNREQVERVEDTMTALIQAAETGGRTPKYSAITHDSGGLTYGAFQADRKSGELAVMLQMYLERANGSPLARAMTPGVQALLRKERWPDGSPAFESLLRRAGNDPVMQQTQRDYFRERHLEPQLRAAAAHGIRTPLGAMIWLDLNLNGGLAAVRTAASRQVPSIRSRADEERFIGAMIEARDARFKRLAQSAKFRPYRAGWLARNDDHRRLLRAGNVALAGSVPVRSKGFEVCGGTQRDATAFSNWMASNAR